jgi:hypothetical protein
VARFLIAFIIISTIPFIRHALFPDPLPRLDKMLRRADLLGCTLNIERRDERLIVMTVKVDGMQPIATEIYKGGVRELAPAGDFRTFFAHSINDNTEGITYLTRTLIKTDPDLNRL